MADFIGPPLPPGKRWATPPSGGKGISFSIKWEGDVGRVLLRAADKLRNYRPMLETIGRQVSASSKRSFSRQASPAGEQWDPLKRPRGRKHNQNMFVLFDTGKLMRGIDYKVVSSNAVAVGWSPSTPYGVHHQYGAPRANIPRREFVGSEPESIPEQVQLWAEGVFSWLP